MTTVLLTGATGFLGEYLVREFLEQDNQVIAIGRNAEKLTALHRIADATDRSTQLHTIRTSLDDLLTAELPESAGDIDVVVHAAALSTIWGRWADFYRANVMGTEQVLAFCRRYKVGKLVFVSSPSVYSGRGDRLNLKEDQFDPNNRLNNYIRSKIQAEAVVQAASDIDSIIIRPRGLIGVGDTSIVPRLLQANRTFGLPLFRGGANLVDMTCVENVALAIRLAVNTLLVEKPHQAVYNITNGEPRPFKQITDQLFDGLSITPRYKPRNVTVFFGIASVLELGYRLFRIQKEPPITRYTVCTLGFSQTLDISAAQADLGYQPRASLDEGIKAYVKANS